MVLGPKLQVFGSGLLTVKGGGRIIGFRAGSLSDWTGFHDPAGVFVALSEAQGLPSLAFEGAYASVVSSKDRLLTCGNPHTPDLGPFHKASESRAWKRFALSCLDHQNITGDGPHIPGAVEQVFLDTIASEYGEGSPEWMAKVLGQYPTESDFGLLQRPAIEAAIKLGQETDSQPGDVLRAGLDVGRSQDPTVLSVVRGNHAQPFDIFPPDGDLVLTADKLEPVLLEHGFWPGGGGLAANGQIVVDAGGLGGGLHDILDRRGWRVLEFQAGAGAWNGKLYANARAEAAFLVKARIEAAWHSSKPQRDPEEEETRGRRKAPTPLTIPDDPLLTEELLAHRWYTTPQSRKILEKKDLLRVRLGRSPDRFDALYMAVSKGSGRATIGGELVTF